jgi:hypothetical protein
MEVTVSDLEEGMSMVRYSNLSMFDSWESQDPDELVSQAAKSLVAEGFVDGSEDDVKRELLENPESFDSLDKINMHYMIINSVEPSANGISMTLKDRKEQRNYLFAPSEDVSNFDEGMLCSSVESLEVLEKHLGKTLFPTNKL